MFRTFVTGPTSYLGSHLVERFLAQGSSVRVLLPGDRRSADPTPTGERDALTIVRASPTDHATLIEAMRDCDAVVHLDYEPFGCESTERLWRTNVLHTQFLARCAREAAVGRFLHVSTAATLGGTRRPMQLTEETALRPRRLARLGLPHLVHRRHAEQIVADQMRKGLDAVFVHPGCLLGRHSPIVEAARDRRLRFYPAGGINVVDVDRVVDGCLRALLFGRRGEHYILGGDNLTAREFLECIAPVTGQKAPALRLPGFAARTLARAVRLLETCVPVCPPHSAAALRMTSLFFWYDSDKAEAELGYGPTIGEPVGEPEPEVIPVRRSLAHPA